MSCCLLGGHCVKQVAQLREVRPRDGGATSALGRFLPVAMVTGFSTRQLAVLVRPAVVAQSGLLTSLAF